MNDQKKLNKVPPVWVFSMTNNLRYFFKKLYYSFVPASVAAFEKSQGFWIAKAISVACELNLAEIIDKEEKTVEEIAKQSNTDAPALYRLMRALASEGVFKETNPKTFKNNKFSNALLEDPGNFKNMIKQQLNDTNWEIINGLKYSVTSGTNTAQKILGSDIFTHLENTPEKNELYNKAMSETSLLSSAAIVSAYNFRGVDTLADLGGGDGTLLFNILQKHHQFNGILFDLPHVVQSALEQAKRFGVENRVQIISGSFFDAEIPAADTYILKNILHVFDDETSIRLLKSIRKAMNGKGKILVVEAVISEDNKPAFGKIFDLQMLLGSESGKERTEEEFRNIFTQAGFDLSRVVKTVSPLCIVEGNRI